MAFALPKTLTTASPAVLLFNSGLLQMPGIAQPTAGCIGRVVEMNGRLLTGFGPCLGLAASK